jgi:hypothetical protein
MARRLLLLVLFLAMLLELALAGGIFVAPAFSARLLGVRQTPDTLFLGYALAWMLLFVGLVAGLAFRQVWRRQGSYATLCYLLGAWWIGLGLEIYFMSGRPDSLLFDSAKGLLIVLLTWRCQAARILPRRY